MNILENTNNNSIIQQHYHHNHKPLNEYEMALSTLSTKNNETAKNPSNTRIRKSNFHNIQTAIKTKEHHMIPKILRIKESKQRNCIHTRIQPCINGQPQKQPDRVVFTYKTQSTRPFAKP